MIKKYLNNKPKMEELFPNVYFIGENILDLTKYDIYGNSTISYNS